MLDNTGEMHVLVLLLGIILLRHAMHIELASSC